MYKILYVNPIGRNSFDEPTRRFIDEIRSPEFHCVVRSLQSGPPHLEYHLYEHDAFTPMLQLLLESQRNGFDAAVIGCFYDGGLREAREALTMPVIGMAESSLAYASTLGHKFSMLVGRRKWVRKMEENVTLYGHAAKLASTRIVGMSIDDMEEQPERFFDRCIEEANLAVEMDGAEVIILSEFATPAFWQRARQEVLVPLIDPGVVAWKFAEMAASLYRGQGYSHSKVGGYESPPAEYLAHL